MAHFKDLNSRRTDGSHQLKSLKIVNHWAKTHIQDPLNMEGNVTDTLQHLVLSLTSISVYTPRAENSC